MSSITQESGIHLHLTEPDCIKIKDGDDGCHECLTELYGRPVHEDMIVFPNMRWFLYE